MDNTIIKCVFVPDFERNTIEKRSLYMMEIACIIIRFEKIGLKQQNHKRSFAPIFNGVRFTSMTGQGIIFDIEHVLEMPYIVRNSSKIPCYAHLSDDKSYIEINSIKKDKYCYEFQTLHDMDTLMVVPKDLIEKFIEDFKKERIELSIWCDEI